MDKLEKYIKENKSALDTVDAPEFNWDAMAAPSKKSSVISLFPWKSSLIAAMILIVFGIGFYLGISNNNQSLTLSSLNNLYPEYATAEVFYSQKIDEELAQFKDSDYEILGLDKSFRSELQLKNETYQLLYKQLNENPHNEQVAIAIVTYYQNKMELINSLKNELQFAKNNVQSYEKNESNK